MRQKRAAGPKRAERWKTASRGQSTRRPETLRHGSPFPGKKGAQLGNLSGLEAMWGCWIHLSSLGFLPTLPYWKPASGPGYKLHFFRGAYVECNKLMLTHSFNFYLLTCHFSFWRFYPQKGCFIRRGRRTSTKEDVFMMLFASLNSSSKTKHDKEGLAQMCSETMWSHHRSLFSWYMASGPMGGGGGLCGRWEDFFCKATTRQSLKENHLSLPRFNQNFKGIWISLLWV